MNLYESPEQEIITKLGILCHLLDSASQVMAELGKLVEGHDQDEINRMIEEHSEKGMNMIAEFLDEVNRD
tara:strand:+ start:543 stop:752 length:210 start_codon:yes stop_codon:yes gene_type:complete